MALPDNIRDLEGPLYVVTHAREYPFAEWRTAMVSCLVGEHGEDAKQMVQALARYVGITLPLDSLYNRGIE